MLQKDGKAWYRSEGIWGGIIAVLVPLAELAGRLAGVDLTLDNAGGGLVAALITIAGGVAAVRGRVKATRVIR